MTAKVSNQNGITLIALVISIIVMLILAGVSINAIVGENGVLTKAQNAVTENKKAGILEAIDLELASYNIDTILTNPESTTDMLNNLISKGLIDSIVSKSGTTTDGSEALAVPQFIENQFTGYTDYGVTKEDYSIVLSVDTTGIYKATFGKINVSSGGSVAAGTTVVTGDAFNSGSSGSGTTAPEEQGKFVIDNDASVMFVDEVGQDGQELSIYVKSGVHAKVNVFKNMTLTNEGIKRSAIDIEAGGTLDLYIADGATLNVNSGFGNVGATAEGQKAGGGMGGYAGIHVPKFEAYNNVQVVSYDKTTKKDVTKVNPIGSATLNVSGEGTLICYGGKAGDGGAALSGTCGGGRWRWRWCWYWRKWWKRWQW